MDPGVAGTTPVPLTGAYSNPNVQEHIAHLHSLAESPDVQD